MRCANANGRFSILDGERLIDVAEASDGTFGPEPLKVLENWSAFRAWGASAGLPGGRSFAASELNAPIPNPRQVFAIGLNYRSHADESQSHLPELPAVFTKFPASIAGPDTTVVLPAEGTTDWEVELVVIIGSPARHVPASKAWEHVAGLTVGQDLSERKRQMVGPIAQFSLGKSYEGFAPIGPYLVTPDELSDPNNLALSCSLNGEQVQAARTSQLIFDIPSLIEHLSGVLTLMPGDLIFTGTPSGVGVARKPPRFIQPDDVLVSSVEGLGEIRQHFTAM